MCPFAELAALIRVSGSLSFSGQGRYAIRISTETGAVARTVVKYTHKLLDLDTSLTVRHSVLHKTRNYLIEIPDQPELADDLVTLGILVPGQGLAQGLPDHLLTRQCCRNAFLRGAFMAGGFIADPRGDFHLEIAVTGEDLAQGIVSLMETVGVAARLNRRRGAFAIYLKSFEDIVRLLEAMGAQRSAHAVEAVRRMKSVKNDVNRRVNAEIANSNRSSRCRCAAACTHRRGRRAHRTSAPASGYPRVLPCAACLPRAPAFGLRAAVHASGFEIGPLSQASAPRGACKGSPRGRA
jgi:cell division protein WhiA